MKPCTQAQETPGSAVFGWACHQGPRVLSTWGAYEDGGICCDTKIGTKRARKLLNLKDSSNRYINLDELIIYQRTMDEAFSPADSGSVV